MSDRRIIFSHSGTGTVFPPHLRLEVDGNDTMYIVMRGKMRPRFSEDNPYACDLPGEEVTLELPYEAFRELENSVNDQGLEAMVKWLEQRVA